MSQEEQTIREKTILIIDDDRDIGDILQQIITDQTQYRTVWIAESDLVLLSAPHLHPSLILLDYMLPIMDGLQLYDHLQTIESMRGVPVVLISAATLLPFEELHKRGIYLLKKPFEMNDLLDLIAQLLSGS
jgi:DNA-binding NtrC family response regulator